MRKSRHARAPVKITSGQRQRLSRIQRSFVLMGFAAMIICLPAQGQEDSTRRWLFDTAVGSQTSFGYQFPSTQYGFTVEQPVTNRFEFQGSMAFSPDKKYITNDGSSIILEGTGIAWLNWRVGASASFERSWLWTSQFDKSAWNPIFGLVMRDSILGPGRFTAGYVFPTGCVWATAANPCLIQSNRTQGVDLGQEWRIMTHLRFGINFGIYHYCAQSNENEPSVPRTCFLAPITMIAFRFEFPGGRANTSY